MDDNKNTNDSMTPVLFLVISVFVLIACILLLKVLIKNIPSSSLTEPLLGANARPFMPGLKREDIEHLLLDAQRWECSICAFYNLNEQQLHCVLCGTPKGYRLIEDKMEEVPMPARSASSSFLNNHRKGSTLLQFTAHIVTAVFEHVLTPQDLNALQRSARMRKQWTRSTGSLPWTRHFVHTSWLPDAFIIQLSSGHSSCPLSDDDSSTGLISWLPIDTLTHHTTVLGTAVAPGTWNSLVELARLPFSLKFAWFLSQLSELMTPYSTLHVHCKVERNRLLDQAMENLTTIKEEALCATMRFEFVGEQARDAGAVQREWYVLVAQALFRETDDNSGLFVMVNREDQTYFINPHASHQFGDFTFRAVGRFVGRALLDGQMLPLHLSPVLLKALLGVPLSLDDVEHFDPVVYKSLIYVATHSNVEDLALTFSATEEIRGGLVEEVDLVENGRSISVMEDNKAQYIQRMVKYLLFDRVATQLEAMIQGLYDIVPPELLVPFDHKEFELILCGLCEIDVQDWKRSTVTSSNLKNHRALVWFWEIVEAMSQADQAKLLQYSTGSARVPVQGFKGLTSYDGKICYFTLRGVPYTTGRYPAIHACYNRIDLPLYPTKELMEEVLKMVLLSDPTGFTIE
ncbi:unnamed protein product [Aphanomyces euteiches]